MIDLRRESYPANRSAGGTRVPLPNAATRIVATPDARAATWAFVFGFIPGGLDMAKINKLCVGESLVGDGNEVAHIDLLIGPRGSSAETAFVHCLTNNKDGFTSLLAVLTPNLLTKPATVMFNKVTIKGAKQAV